MNDKSKTAFYGAGLSLVIGYLLSYVSTAVITGMVYYISSETSMSFADYSHLLYFTPSSLRVAAILCACIFLAIAFYSMSKNLPFIFAILSIALLLGSYVPDILMNGGFISVSDPLDPTYLAGTILYSLFWFSFFVLLILSANLLYSDTESEKLRTLRKAFFILFGLTVFQYFMNYLGAHIDFEIETFTAYLVIFDVLLMLELVCAVATGIIFIISAHQK